MNCECLQDFNKKNPQQFALHFDQAKKETKFGSKNTCGLLMFLWFWFHECVICYDVFNWEEKLVKFGIKSETYSICLLIWFKLDKSIGSISDATFSRFFNNMI